MRPRQKEDPKEWRNFTLLFCGFILAIASVALWRKKIPVEWFGAILAVSIITAMVALARPSLFRGVYRVAMSISFRIGQVMGKVILGLFYLFALTPLGLLLRLSGKDLLEMRRDKSAQTYWKPARKRGKMHQQF